MTVPYHDDLEIRPIDNVCCLVEIERVYGLQWDRFGQGDWSELERVCRSLPGSGRFRQEWWWFGDDEDVPPFLFAHVEPQGFRVHGVLPEADWWAWDQRFRGGAVGLPCRGSEPRPTI